MTEEEGSKTTENPPRTWDERDLERLLEAFLFVADRPLTISQLKDVTGAESEMIRRSLGLIEQECDREKKGFRLKMLAGGYQFVTDPSWAAEVKRFLGLRDLRRVSRASLETLSIIAYRQPITRAEIEYIRGVNVEGALRTLLEKGLIRITGRKEAAGRPILYGTTHDFLDHFGLKDLKDLPRLVEFTDKDIELPETLKARGEVDGSQSTEEEGQRDR